MFFAFRSRGAAAAALSTAALASLALVGSSVAGAESSSRHVTQTRLKIFMCPSNSSVDRSDAQVCCQLPGAGSACVTSATHCKAQRGKAVAKAQCTKKKKLKAKPAKPVSMGQFRAILGGSRSTSDNEWKYVPVRRFALFNTSGNPGSKTPDGKLTEGVYCKGGTSQPCWCEGARTCRKFRAACVKLGGRLKCGGKNRKRRPTHCVCSK